MTDPNEHYRIRAELLRRRGILTELICRGMELRYNESHDPANGQFTSGAGGGAATSKSLTNAAGQAIIKVTSNSLSGPLNGITQRTNSKGGVERNYYDAAGKQYKQIANNDHGHPKKHPFGEHGEHAHDYHYDQSQRLTRTTRNLTKQEREENKDIL